MPEIHHLQHNHEPLTTCAFSVPIFKKMKVLKKIKQKIGLGSRLGSGQLPPLLFHEVCGDNVQIESGGRVARRVESFCKGVTFSNRTVRVGEHICLKLTEISNNWSGVIRFGLTSQDPNELRNSLPKYACPDLTGKPGYWAKALSEQFSKQGTIVFYYVTPTGDVHFGINGEEKGVFFTGVETRCPLWAMVDVYGNSTVVEFVDPFAQLNNRIHILNESNRLNNPQMHSEITANRNSLASRVNQISSSISVDTVLQPSMAQLTIDRNARNSLLYAHLPLHRVHGRNVTFSSDGSVVSRCVNEYSHGYVFTARPLHPGETLSIQVLETEPMYVGALAFGLTSTNPAGLDTRDLPEDCDLLLDRPEYWVVSKDVASSPTVTDVLSFSISISGEVRFSKNNRPPQTIMHVDQSLELWAFFDVYGNTKKIKVLGINVPVPVPAQICNYRPVPQQVLADRRNSSANIAMAASRSSIIAERPAVTAFRHQNHAEERSRASQEGAQNSQYQPKSSTCTLSRSCSTTNTTAVFHECTVCYENAVDSVLYTCGHMCMCYDCAVQQWGGRCGVGGGLCPICRAPISDVIRTYRS